MIKIFLFPASTKYGSRRCFSYGSFAGGVSSPPLAAATASHQNLSGFATNRTISSF
jgi:hypothetical protein